MISKGVIIKYDKVKIKVCQNIINTLSNYVQKGSCSIESGGILIGKENKSNKNIIINHITTPMIKDKSKYDRFIRRDKGHVEVFNRLYVFSSGTVRYIGEWHTHPEAVPNFSNLDEKNWNEITSDSKNNNDYFHIIVGYEAIRIWITNSKNCHAKLVKTILWKEVEQGEIL